MIINHMKMFFFLFMLSLVCACGKDNPVNSETEEDQTEITKHVVVIGLDGVRSDALIAASTPNIDALIADGAVTYHAFAGGIKGTATEQATSSGPGWSSILTGVWVNKHKVRDNSFSGADYTQYPHFFRRIKQVDSDAYLSSIVHWSPINEKILLDADYQSTGSDQLVALQALTHLEKQNPTVLFLHFDDVDGAGHSFGFSPNSKEYLAAITEVDKHVGTVVRGVQNRGNYKNEEWLFIVTSDHGGAGTGHGGQSDGERTIFILVSGKGTLKGELNDSPGMVAVPPTVLTFLQIPINPDWGWESTPFGLEK